VFKNASRGTVAAFAAAVPVAFLAVFFVWPLLVTARSAIDGAGIAGQDTTISVRALGVAAITTLGLASAGTGLTLIIGLPAVWALNRRRWRGSRLVAALLTAPFVLPTVVVALAFLTVRRDVMPFLGAWHGIPAIIAALAFFNVAVVLRTVGPALSSLDERLVAAAQTLGASPRHVTMRIIWPAVRRAVGGASAVTFLFCSTSFGLVLVLGGTRVQTLETAAYIELTAFLDLRGAAIIALIQACLIVLVTIVTSRLTRRPVGSTTQTSPVRIAATRKNSFGIIAGLSPAVVLVAVPMVTLVIRSLTGAHGATFASYRALWQGDGAGASLGQSIVTSLWLAVVAAVVASTIGVCATAAAALDPRARWVRAATVGPLAVSSVVVGVALLIGLAVPLRSWGQSTTVVLLIAAQALVATPLVVRVLAPALDAIDPRQYAAAATLGASPFKVVVHVIAPRMRAAITSAIGLAFAVAVGEFGASVFLARPGSPTLPTAIVRLLSKPGADNIAAASAGAVVLALLAGTAMIVADMTRKEVRR